MKLYQIRPLLQDMGRNKAKQDKFSFKYNGVTFDVIVFLEYTPFELLFGVVDHNFSFVLKLHSGYDLEDLPNDVFYELCRILNLKPSKEGLTSFKFLKYFADRIPSKYSGRKVEPHEIAVHKKRNVPDSDKIYFKGWRSHETDGRQVQNLEKTRAWLGEEAYAYCKKYNISSCWSDIPNERKPYYSPDKHRETNKI